MRLLIVIMSVCLVMIAAHAQSRFSYSIWLSGQNERPFPPTPSMATGSAEISLEILPLFTTIVWNVHWNRLSGLPIGASIHGLAGAGTSAPVLFSLGNFFSDSSPDSGGYAGFRQLSDPLQTAAIRDGLAFVNIRTEQYPDGEIRGQLQAIPERCTCTAIVFFALALKLFSASTSPLNNQLKSTRGALPRLGVGRRNPHFVN